MSDEYKDLHSARVARDEAHEEVQRARRRLRAARTYMADFPQRDERITAAKEDLDDALEVHARLSREFDELRAQA